MKYLYVFFLSMIPFLSNGQEAYFDAGYTGFAPKGSYSSGIYFGAGKMIGIGSIGFVASFENLGKSDYILTAADFRFYHKKHFISLQPGWLLTKGNQVNGGFYGGGYLGTTYKFITVFAGYQNIGTRVNKTGFRQGGFKFGAAITLY